MISGKTADETTRFEKIGMSGSAKFRTACGRTFDSNVALAEYLGVDKSSVSHAVCDAKAKGRMFFECGKPHKRCVTMLKPNVASDSEKDEICNLQSFAYNACGKTNKNTQNTQHTQNTQCNASCEPCIVPTTIQEQFTAMQVHTHLQAASLKLFPERKLRLLQMNDSNRYFPVQSRKDAGAYKFNVVDTWYIHAEQTDKSLAWFTQQVDASINNKVLKTDTYASLLVEASNFARYKRAFLNAEDMLSFLQHYVVMFEDEQQPKNMQEEAELEALSSPPTYEESLKVNYDCIKTPPLRPAISERKRTFEEACTETFKETCGMEAADEFMTMCDKVMRNVDQAVLQRLELAELATNSNREGDKDTVKKRKTYLACDSVRNITSILLAANKFLYAACKEF